MLKNFLLIPFSLRSIVVTAMLLFVGNVSFSQVRPDQAPTKSPADTDEIYTQYLGVLNRIKFSDAKVYFQSGLSLSWNSATNELTIGGGNTVDISSLNTDDQQLTRSGMVLSLDDGGSVDLSPLFSGIDDQTLSFNSVTGELTIQDGNTVDLSTLESDGSETKVNAGTNVTITGSGTIADPYVVNASSGTATVGDGDYGDVIVSSGGTVWTVTGGGSTQVADLTALAASSFPAGTLVTVQSNGATYKISASESPNGDLVVSDANSNSAKLQPNDLGEIVASHLSSIDRDVLQDIENYCEAEGYKGVYIDIASFTIDHTLDNQDIEISTDFSIRGLGENKTTLNITPLTPNNHNYNVFLLDSDIKFEISDMSIIGANTNTQTGANPENSAQTVLISTTLSSGESGQMLLNNMTIDAEYYTTISVGSGSADATTFYDVRIINVDNYNNFGGGIGYFNTNASTGNCSFSMKNSTWDGMGLTDAENNGNGDWSHGIYLHPNIETVIENCIISNTARFGLNVRSTSVTESATNFSIENTIFSECTEGAINIEETIARFFNCTFINSRLSANERGGLFVQNSKSYEESDNRSVISVGNDMQITLLGNTFEYTPPASPTQPIIQLTNSGTATILGNTFNTDATGVNIINVSNASLTSSIMNNTINAPTHTGTAISINLGSHSVAFNGYDGLGDVQQINNGSTTPPTLEISNSLFQEVPASSATDILFSTKKALFFSADNSGLGIEDMYTANVNSGFTRTIGSTGLRWISAADGSQAGQFFIKTANGSSVTEKFSIDNLGTFKFNEYGLGNFEDTDLSKTESAFVLVPATDGTILEKPISEISGGGGSVWTNLDGTGATSSSTDIKYNGGQVGVGFEDSETLPSSKSLAVEGNMSIQREDGAGFTSLTGYRDNGTTPVWQIHDKNFAMNLSLTDGGENLVITNNGVIVGGNVPRGRLSSQHGSQWQLALQDDANKATLVRHEDDGLTRIAFTDDGGSTTKDLFWRGNGNDISTTNSLTGVVGHINSIIKLTDNIDDDTKVAYTIPVVSYKHTASIFFICDSSSENDGGDGCAVETANAVLINGSSNFILPELGKVYELRYSEDLGEWFIMNL